MRVARPETRRNLSDLYKAILEFAKANHLKICGEDDV